MATQGGSAIRATTPIVAYDITGVEAAYTNLTERGATDAVVKLTLLYSESGLSSIVEAAVVGTVKGDSITGKIKSFFAGSSSGESSTSTEGATSTESAATAEETKPAEPVERVESIPLELKVTPKDILPLTVDEKHKTRSRLLQLNKAARIQREREEAYNVLEGFLNAASDTAGLGSGVSGASVNPSRRYGADTMKVALMKPGVPLNIVLDRDSKRKIASVVGCKGEDRSFGQDGRNLAARVHVRLWRDIVLHVCRPGRVHPDISRFVGKRPNGNQYTLEELVAMQLDHRQAAIDATEIVELRLLTLVNDGTAIAVDHAMMRTRPTKECTPRSCTSSTTRAHPPPARPSSRDEADHHRRKEVRKIQKRNSHYDPWLRCQHTASSTELSCRLNKVFLDPLPASFKNGLIDENYAKHAREAERVKAILSVSAGVIAGVGGLVGERDWKGKIERRMYWKEHEDLY
ncbi:actin-like ATPase domain protein [Ceratobasidium sp. AG-Ba]|nr:actin-like ATPase domain protein [Ceratobasidium sp. AG-Ba]